MTHQNAVGGRGSYRASRGQSHRSDPVLPPRDEQACLGVGIGQCRAAMRMTGPADHVGLVLLVVTLGPPFGRGHRALEPFRGPAQGPTIIDDTTGGPVPLWRGRSRFRDGSRFTPLIIPAERDPARVRL